MGSFVTVPSPSGPSAPALPPAGFALLASVSLLWGVNWPAMKMALAAFDPWTFRFACLAVGGATLLAVSVIGRKSLKVPYTDRIPMIVSAALNVTGWQVFSSLGLTMMPAGRAAIIAFTMPLWASLLAALLLGERLTRARVAGLGLGLAGMACLLLPDIARIAAAPWGVLFMLAAAISWAAGTVAVKRHRWSMDSVPLTGWQLLLGGVPVGIGVALFGHPADGFAHATPASLWAALYAVSLPVSYSYWAWYRVVALFPANVASMGTLAIPVIGVLSSAALLGESVGWPEIAALVLVLAALSLVLLVPGRR